MPMQPKPSVEIPSLPEPRTRFSMLISFFCTTALLPWASGVDEDLERFAVVHGSVAVGCLVEADGAVEDPPRLDGSVQHDRQQLLHIGACGGDAAGEGEVAHEHVHAD